MKNTVPIEAILDIKYMTLFNNICRQHDDAIEKQLVTRQLNIKTNESKNWFTILKKTLIRPAIILFRPAFISQSWSGKLTLFSQLAY
jgi:hypothetical protein